MTICEQAFVEYMRKVCPSLNNPRDYPDRFIVETFYEAFMDWCAAVRWGQMNAELVP